MKEEPQIITRTPVVILIIGLIGSFILTTSAAASAGDSALYEVTASAPNEVWAVGYKYQGHFSAP